MSTLWTDDMDYRVADFYGRGFTVTDIARKVLGNDSHHHRNLVSDRLKALDIVTTNRKREGYYSCQQLAEDFFGGHVSRMTAYNWYRHGVLQGARKNVRKGGIRYIALEEILGFLERPDYWMLWRPEWITNDYAREYAEYLRAGVTWRWLTAEEAGDVLCVHPRSVLGYVERGYLPGVRRGKPFWVRSDHVAYLAAHPDLHPHSGDRRVYGRHEIKIAALTTAYAAMDNSASLEWS